MPTDGYMDAAAIGTPDADDTLRERLIEAAVVVWQQRSDERITASPTEHCAAMIDALMPAIREAIAAATARLDRDINDRVAVLSTLREALYEGGQYDEHRARKARAIIHEWETSR